MPRMIVGLVKLSIKTSTANTVDAEVDALLAQAELIKDNPDSFLPADEVFAEAELV